MALIAPSHAHPPIHTLHTLHYSRLFLCTPPPYTVDYQYVHTYILQYTTQHLQIDCIFIYRRPPLRLLKPRINHSISLPPRRAINAIPSPNTYFHHGLVSFLMPHPALVSSHFSSFPAIWTLSCHICTVLYILYSACLEHYNTTLYPGQSLTFVASTEAKPNLDGENALRSQHNHEQRLIDRWKMDRSKKVENAPAWIRQLILAADQFV